MEELAFLRSAVATPDDPAPLLVFADWLEERGNRLAKQVRQWAGSEPTCGLGWPSVALLFVPQPLGVRFAASCAEHVQPLLAARFLAEGRPAAALSAIRRWLQGEATKRQVREASQDLLGLIVAVEDGRGEVLDPGWLEDSREAVQAYWAARSAYEAAFAVGFVPSNKEWRSAAQSASGFALDAASPGNPHRVRGKWRLDWEYRQELQWQRDRLAELLT